MPVSNVGNNVISKTVLLTVAYFRHQNLPSRELKARPTTVAAADGPLRVRNTTTTYISRLRRIAKSIQHRTVMVGLLLLTRNYTTCSSNAVFANWKQRQLDSIPENRRRKRMHV
jgi:hypothetical protein